MFMTILYKLKWLDVIDGLELLSFLPYSNIDAVSSLMANILVLAHWCINYNLKTLVQLYWTFKFDVFILVWSKFFHKNFIGKASKFLHIEDEKHYHSSAVYAAALHSISLPFRLVPVGPTKDACSASGAVDFHGLIQILSGQGRQNMVSVLDVAMPTPALTGTCE